MRRRNGYVQLGLTAFLTVAAILLFYDTLFGSAAAVTFGRQLAEALEPVILGALLAYLLSPVVDFFERDLFRRQAGEKTPAWIRALSLLLTWALIGVGLYLLSSVLLPELYKSILQLVSNVENYYRKISGWVQELLNANQTAETWVEEQMDKAFARGKTWLENEALPQAQTVMVLAAGGLVSVVGFMKNLLVGAIVSIYLLATKEHCAAHARKLVCGLLSREWAERTLRGVHKADEIFSGFVRGKLLDSLIIGIICFVCCGFFDFPYAPLVSVIVGVTNLIPFFGPFLGAIPSTFLILLASPIKALYFVIFILILQQVDGNIIGPKILGGRTGLSSLWVIIAILVGGSFFGIPGMFFGVPVCACIHCAVNAFVDARLRRREMPLDTDAYASEVPTPPEPKGKDL